jgi:aspartate aminotransferase
MELKTSRRIAAVLECAAPLLRFETESAWARRPLDRPICDFTFGNPHEMPLAGFTEALNRWSVPQRPDWHAYQMSVPAAQAAVAEGLRRRYAVAFEAADIALTSGAFAGIAVALAAIVDPGDEVIFISPPWFNYEALITAAYATPVRVRADEATWDLDLNAVGAALNDRTRAIIINSPHNPTGKIYPRATLTALADRLAAAGAHFGRPIYLVSDDAYSRIVYPGRQYRSPATFYPYSFLVYTYGKTLLTPGERLGYLALPPSMPDREQMRQAIMAAQVITGYAFPNAILQYAVPDLEQLSIDISALQHKRDLLASALAAMGYQVNSPAGTF